MTTSTVTITHTTDDGTDHVFVDATNEDGDLDLVEALGVIELGKATLVSQVP